MEDNVERRIQQLAERWPQIDASSVPIAGRIGAVALHLGRLSEEIFGPHGIRQGEADVLAALWRVGSPYELSPGRLRQSVSISSGGMTARLDRLATMGLIERHPDPADRRGVLVRLTDRGAQLTGRLVREYLARQTDFLSVLKPAERNQLVRVLRKLTVAATQTKRT